MQTKQFFPLISALLFMIFLVLNADAQTRTGTIKYKQTMFFEFENMPPNMPKSSDAYMQLKFNGVEALYEKDPDVKDDQSADASDGSRRWRRMRDRSKRILYSNTGTSSVVEQTGLMGKDFLISDSLKNLKWKVKFIEVVAQARPRALARLLWHPVKKIDHAIRWYYQMGRRGWFHEVISFFLRERRVKDGVTVAEFLGASQEVEEESMAVKKRAAA